MNIDEKLIKETVVNMFKNGDLKLGVHVESSGGRIEIEVGMLDSEGTELDASIGNHWFYLD